jgi:putative CocE/NonD family hydrolase
MQLTVESARVAMRDGVQLATEVTRVDGVPPRPVLLIRTPYGMGSARASQDPVGLARGGWAVVIQDVRGRSDSEGTFEPFVQEVADGYDAVEWCVQQPWCDGRVAMSGLSYVGATQWAAAVSGHPALRAVNPMLAAGDVSPAWMHEGGAFQLGMVQPWALGLAATAPGITDELRGLIGWVGGQWQAVYELPQSQDPVPHLFAPYRKWREAAVAGAWASADVTHHYDELRTGVFQVAGWYDIFCESALRHHQALDQRLDAPPHRLVIGPWAHTERLSNLYPEYDFGGQANGGFRDVHGESSRWMRAHLDGEPVPGGVDCFVMGSHVWREFSSWPPPPAHEVRLFLSSGLEGANSRHGDGVLGWSAPTRPGEDRYGYDPLHPVPTRGGRILGPFLPMAGPVDQRPVEDRRDVLVYSGDPVRDAVTVIGPVRAELVVESTAPSADFTVKLCDVHPDGRVFNIVDSVRRVRLQPGVPQPVQIQVGSTAHCFLPGHRVRVEVSSSNFPRLDRNPSTTEDPASAPELLPAAQRVHWGADTGSSIVLPIVD